MASPAIDGLLDTDSPAVPSKDPTINPSLKKKVQKVLASNIEDDDLLSALKHLSSFYGPNTLDARWSLRDRLETRTITINQQFLDAFGKIQDELAEVRSDVASIKRSCDEMQARLNENKAASGKLIQQADSLFRTEAQTDTQLKVANAFLEKFQLSPTEEKSIKSPEVSREFFSALKRAQQIHNDCNVLLHTKNQRAGLEIREQMVELMESGYRKLYRWVSAECKVFERDAPELPTLLVAAFDALQERPVLLNYCLEEIGSIRNKSLVRAFIEALTKGGPNGIPKPIEMHAHDPTRFVGDMAAWIHQALASEQEVFSTVLRLVRHETDEEKRRFDEYLSRVVPVALSGVCRPFKLRVDQIFATQTSVQVAFGLANLFQFYNERFRELVPETAQVVVLFDQCQASAKEALDKLVKAQQGST